MARGLGLIIEDPRGLRLLNTTVGNDTKTGELS
jgi:hypothetical protein